MASDESFVRALHERTEGVPLFVASVTSDVAARSAQSGVATAALLANSPVPENLFAIIDHYLAKLGNERRMLLSAAAVCGTRVSHRHAGARARTRRPLRLRTRAISCCASNFGSSLRVRGITARFAREAVFLPSRSIPASALRSPRAVRPRRASPQGRGCARAGASHGGRRRRGGTRDALRSRPRAAGGAALLRRGGGSRSAAREPGRVHELDGACVEPAGPGARQVWNAPRSRSRSRHCGAFLLSTCSGPGTRHAAPTSAASSLLADVPRPSDARPCCCTGSGSCSICARSTPRRLPPRIERTLSHSVPEMRFLRSPRAPRGHRRTCRGPTGRGPRIAGARASSDRSQLNAASEQSFIGFIADPQVTVLAMLSLPLAHVGMVSHARERLQQAYARARRLAQPMALMVTMWFDALLRDPSSAMRTVWRPGRRDALTRRGVCARPRQERHVAGFAGGRTPIAGSRSKGFSRFALRTRRTRRWG